jgi:hypothetical protein
LEGRFGAPRSTIKVRFTARLTKKQVGFSETQDPEQDLPAIMDITKFIVSSRERALSLGDYGTYRAQLSRKLLNSRRKLNIVTKNRGKYHPKALVSAEELAENHE